MTQFRIEIEGMTCAGCVGKVERALSAVPGVHKATVNFAARNALVESDETSLDALTAAIAEAGYTVRSETVSLEVSNMSCASCVGRVEDVLLQQPGVLDAAVNFASGSATVRYLAGQTEASQLARAVSKIGYPSRAADVAQYPGARQDAEAVEALKRTLIAGALTLPVFVIEMGGHLFPALHHLVHQTIGQETSWLLQFALTTLVLLWPGREFFQRGVPAILRGAPEMNSLVVLGTSAAWGFSTVALFFPSLLPEGTRAVYFEAAAVIRHVDFAGALAGSQSKGANRRSNSQAHWPSARHGVGSAKREVRGNSVGRRSARRHAFGQTG